MTMCQQFSFELISSWTDTQINIHTIHLECRRSITDQSDRNLKLLSMLDNCQKLKRKTKFTRAIFLKISKN